MYVVCRECGGTHEPNVIKTLNVEEDIEGRDVLEFICPVTKEPTKSIILGNQYNFGRKACWIFYIVYYTMHCIKCYVYDCLRLFTNH